MKPRNLREFPEGAVVRSVYDGCVYRIVSHTPRGITYVERLHGHGPMCWNSNNNAHFVDAYGFDFSILFGILAQNNVLCP